MYYYFKFSYRPTVTQNLWDGLQTGLNILSKEQDSVGSISALFLLTDGCPNVEPDRWSYRSIRKFEENN